MLIRKALYGLRSSGAAFRAHLAETLYDIGFVPTRADPDVWHRPAAKEDGFEYYEYVLCYVDDIGVVGICVSGFSCMLHHSYLASYSTSSLVEP